MSSPFGSTGTKTTHMNGLTELEGMFRTVMERMGYVHGARVECEERSEFGTLDFPDGITFKEGTFEIQDVTFRTTDNNEVNVIYNGIPQPMMEVEQLTPEEVFDRFGVKVKL